MNNTVTSASEIGVKPIKAGPSQKLSGGARGLPDRAIAWLFIAPTMILLLALNIFPLIWTVYLSFTNYRANRPNAEIEGVGDRFPIGGKKQEPVALGKIGAIDREGPLSGRARGHHSAIPRDGRGHRGRQRPGLIHEGVGDLEGRQFQSIGGQPGVPIGDLVGFV